MSTQRNNLDHDLQSESQLKIREIVRALPQESLSLSWRSQLNERLLQSKVQPRWKVRLVQNWKPALGLAVAGCLALTVSLRTLVHAPSDRSGLEASLVKAYNDTSRIDDLVGAGLSAHEVGDTTRTSDASADWTETDLNAL